MSAADRHLVRWIDQNGGEHSTRWHEGPTGLLRALCTARTDAKRMGLEIKRADGVTQMRRQPGQAENPVDDPTEAPATSDSRAVP